MASKERDTVDGSSGVLWLWQIRPFGIIDERGKTIDGFRLVETAALEARRQRGLPWEDRQFLGSDDPARNEGDEWNEREHRAQADPAARHECEV